MSIDRRTFLQTTSLTAAWLAMPGGAASARARLDRIGVQLYTARDAMAKDFEGTLQKIAAIGYKEVEFAGYFDKTPQQVKAIVARAGLTAPSTHIGYDVLSTKAEETIAASHVIGHTFIVMPYLDDTQRKQPDIYKRVAETLNRVGAASQKAGIQVAYHNHNFEFFPENGVAPYDLLLKECDPKLVKMELDLCWIAAAGLDPLTYFAKYPGRFPMVHVKDLKKVPQRQPGDTGPIPLDRVMPDLADVGSGIIDWNRIFAKSSQAGIQHYFVEHDQPTSVFDDLTKSYQYLKGLHAV